MPGFSAAFDRIFVCPHHTDINHVARTKQYLKKTTELDLISRKRNVPIQARDRKTVKLKCRFRKKNKAIFSNQPSMHQ